MSVVTNTWVEKQNKQGAASLHAKQKDLKNDEKKGTEIKYQRASRYKTLRGLRK